MASTAWETKLVEEIESLENQIGHKPIHLEATANKSRMNKLKERNEGFRSIACNVATLKKRL